MDSLSQVLRLLHLHGSCYEAWDLAAPWGLALGRARFAPFHYVESGELWLVTAEGERVHLQTGDVAVVFDGAEHRIADRPDRIADPFERVKGRQRGAAVKRHGGGGRACRVVIGKFLLEEDHDGGAGVLRQLPPLVHIRNERAAQLAAFPPALALLARELRNDQPGADRAAKLLTEILFIHVVRVVLADAEPVGAGLLAGLRDPQIGAVLAAIHAEPERQWTLTGLARHAGLSRSVFAERFHDRLGVPPMAYLARWRLQLAARALRESQQSISEILHQVGYASPAAFHRAFKRVYGAAPTEYRRAADRDRVVDDHAH